MNLRFYNNPETGEPHIYDHNVTEEEVEDVLDAYQRITRGSGRSLIATGQTRSGRWLMVVFVEDPRPNSYFVITAYPPPPKALRAIRRHGRKKR